MADIRFDLAGPADLEALLAMARNFHLEDGHPLDEAGESALARICDGEPLARAWLMREDERAQVTSSSPWATASNMADGTVSSTISM